MCIPSVAPLISCKLYVKSCKIYHVNATSTGRSIDTYQGCHGKMQHRQSVWVPKTAKKKLCKSLLKHENKAEVRKYNYKYCGYIAHVPETK